MTEDTVTVSSTEGMPAQSEAATSTPLAEGAALVPEEPTTPSSGSTAAPNDNPQGPGPVTPVMVNFVIDVVQPKNPEGPGYALVAAVNGLVGAGMAAGFSEEEATRATAIYLINICWQTLIQHTGLMGQTMLKILFKPAAPAEAPQA